MQHDISFLVSYVTVAFTNRSPPASLKLQKHLTNGEQIKKTDHSFEVFPLHQAGEMIWILPCQKKIHAIKITTVIIITKAKSIVGMDQ